MMTKNYFGFSQVGVLPGFGCLRASKNPDKGMAMPLCPVFEL